MRHTRAEPQPAPSRPARRLPAPGTAAAPQRGGRGRAAAGADEALRALPLGCCAAVSGPKGSACRSHLRSPKENETAKFFPLQLIKRRTVRASLGNKDRVKNRSEEIAAGKAFLNLDPKNLSQE